MLWALKRTVSLIFLFLNHNICCGLGTQKNRLEQQTYVLTDQLENIYNFTLKIFVYLNLWST